MRRFEFGDELRKVVALSPMLYFSQSSQCVDLVKQHNPAATTLTTIDIARDSKWSRWLPGELWRFASSKVRFIPFLVAWINICAVARIVIQSYT